MKLRNVELEHIRNTMETYVFRGTSFSELIIRLLEEAEQLREENEQLKKGLEAYKKASYYFQEENERLKLPRPLKEWHEDHGDVLWWTFPIEEPPYCGTPLDDDWPEHHTHWTPIICPNQPKEETK